MAPDFYEEKSAKKLKTISIARREFVRGIMGAKTMTREMDETELNEIEKVETDKLPERGETESAKDEPISAMKTVRFIWHDVEQALRRNFGVGYPVGTTSSSRR